MRVTIENDILSVNSKTAGAELTGIRLKSDGTEYLWQADPKYWARHSPVLFPIVGSVKDNRYTYGGKQYAMKNHGFARDAEFDIAHEADDGVTYRLTGSPETLSAYPFRFRLEIGYALHGNAVSVLWRVFNEDGKDMYFSIGAHPAFNCPIAPGDPFTDYYLEFENAETLERQYVDAANLLVAGKSAPFLSGGRILPMAEGMFDDGAYVLDGPKSTSVALKGHSTAKSVTVSFPGFPQLGLWAPKDAPFVCIEPWFGIAESTDFTGDLTQKKGVLGLKPGGVFTSEYKIILT